MAERIHPSAIIEDGAVLGENVTIGPWSIVGAHVTIGDGCEIGAHVVLSGHTEIGRNNRIFPFCAIGCEPQDKKYGGEATRLVIGEGNTIREHCTFSTGTVQDGGITRVGNGNWVMANVHIAHDCEVGDNTILANNVTLAGHVHLGDWVILGGLTAVHQFTRIGAHSMCGGGSILLQDLPPFVTVTGNPAAPHGTNSEGLRRRGYSRDAIAAVKRAYRVLYRSGLTLAQAREEIEAMAQATPELLILRDFLCADSQRGIVR